jgi:hypothetical protein
MIPPLRVVAFNAANPSIYYFVDTSSWNFGDPLPNRFYTITGLPAGVYHVVSYLPGYDNLVGGYTQAVPCGLAVGCNDHSLIDVTVIAGQTTSNINPGDWYAGPGAFPSMPNP